MEKGFEIMMKLLSALIGVLAMVGFATAALADTQMEKALADGAKRMTADEIVERLAGKTVTFELASTGDKFLVFYDGANGTLLKKVGSNSVGEGFYATSLADHICLGMKTDKPIRLRCVTVLLIDDKMHKYELDGSLRGRVIEETEGNIM